MNPAKIQSKQQYQNFVRVFDHEIRTKPLQATLQEAYSEYQRKANQRFNLFFRWSFNSVTRGVGSVAITTFKAIADLKLFFSLGNDAGAWNNPTIRKHLSQKRRLIYLRGKSIKNDCEKISTLIQKFHPQKLTNPEKEFTEKLKDAYVQRFRQFSDLIDDSILSDEQFLNIIKKDFHYIESDLAKIQCRLVKILKEQPEFNYEGETNKIAKQSPRQLSICKHRLMNQDLCLTAEKEALLVKLKERVLRNEISSSTAEKESLIKIIDNRTECTFKDIQQKLDTQKVEKHKNLQRGDAFELRKVKLNNQAIPSWTLTPAGRILNETIIPDASLEIIDFTRNDFQETIEGLKRKRCHLKQKLHLVRNDLLNLDNENPKASQKKLLLLENSIKQINLAIYQSFINKLIDIVGECQLLKRKRKESINLRESNIAYLKIFSDYIQKLAAIENTLSTVQKTPKGSYIEMLSAKNGDVPLPGMNHFLMSYWRKHKRPLRELPKIISKEIEGLEAINLNERSEILTTERKCTVLDAHFEELMMKYQRAYSDLPSSSIPQAILNQLFRSLMWVLSLGYFKVNNPAPSEFFRRKDLANLGYNIHYDVKKWIEQLKVKPGENWIEVLRRELRCFVEWATDHPKAASQMAGDIFQLFTVFTDKNEFLKLASTLKASVFTYAILGALGRPLQEQPDTENELRFRALADLLRYAPLGGRLLKTGYNMWGDYKSTNPVWSLLSSLFNGIFHASVDKTVRDVIDATPAEISITVLQIFRVVANIVHGQAYVDSVVEKQKAEFFNKASQGAQLILRPRSIKNNFVQWVRLISASRGKEKFLRVLSPISIMGLGASVAMPVSWGLYVFFGTLGIFPAIGLSLFFLIYALSKVIKANDLLNEIFPNTFEHIRRFEAASIYENMADEMKGVMDKNMLNLQRRGILPNEVKLGEKLDHWSNTKVYSSVSKWLNVDFQQKLDKFEKLEKQTKLKIKPNDYLYLFVQELLKKDYQLDVVTRLRESFKNGGITANITEDDFKEIANKVINQSILHNAQNWLKERLLESYKTEFIENYVNFKVSPYRPAHHHPNANQDPEIVLENLLRTECAKLDSSLAISLEDKILREIVRTYVA